jgi:hypothetical protein
MPDCEEALFPEFHQKEQLAEKAAAKLASKAAGVYDVAILWHGFELIVTIDDFVPVLDGESCFVNSPDGSLWAVLYLKACAKLLGSYEGLCMARRPQPQHAVVLSHFAEIQENVSTHRSVIRNALLQVAERPCCKLSSCVTVSGCHAVFSLAVNLCTVCLNGCSTSISGQSCRFASFSSPLSECLSLSSVALVES